MIGLNLQERIQVDLVTRTPFQLSALGKATQSIQSRLIRLAGVDTTVEVTGKTADSALSG